jgi:hypothetical protein
MKALIKILLALAMLVGVNGAIYAWQNGMPPSQQTDTAKAAKQPKAYPPPVPGQPKPDRPKPLPPNNYKQPVSPPDTSHQTVPKSSKAKLGGEQQPDKSNSH